MRYYDSEHHTQQTHNMYDLGDTTLTSDLVNAF
jgi:hypothetical protein